MTLIFKGRHVYYMFQVPEKNEHDYAPNVSQVFVASFRKLFEKDLKKKNGCFRLP